MRNTLHESSTEDLIYSENSDPVMEQGEIPNRINWRSRIAMFRKTSAVVQPARTHTKPYCLTPEEVHQWSQSLDKLLNNKYGTAAFRLFMKTEFCEENIEFWLACEEFRQIKSPAKRTFRAKAIYKKFIKNKSPKEVLLDAHTKDTIFQNLQSSMQSSFAVAQVKVYSLMEHNSYPRFLQSQFYSQICQLATDRQFKEP
ncbi:regulator of G-protein signaling 2 [Brachyhypopomus gauderio]|uniref:regulator of G-protein signaling 2 n=1 Tax=Brachyhypopomus gauderio TaxID=698409 RepID=UPI0040423AB0